jgi:hypothetical protein
MTTKRHQRMHECPQVRLRDVQAGRGRGEGAGGAQRLRARRPVSAYACTCKGVDVRGSSWVVPTAWCCCYDTRTDPMPISPSNHSKIEIEKSKQGQALVDSAGKCVPYLHAWYACNTLTRAACVNETQPHTTTIPQHTPNTDGCDS